MSVDGKVVVITGGSKGIGKGLVEAFAKAGATVYYTYLTNEESAFELQDNLSTLGHLTYAHHVDNSCSSSVSSFISNVISNTGKVDILINNAGFIPRGLFLNTSTTVMSKAFDVNFNGVSNFCNAVLKNMVKHKSGVILNISSLSAIRPAKGQAAYSASKAAIETLSNVLALEYGRYNIRVNTIAPGLVETDVVKTLSEKLKEDIIQKTPLRRLGSIEDVCNAALFLASDQAKFITGTQLLLTGGKHLS